MMIYDCDDATGIFDRSRHVFETETETETALLSEDEVTTPNTRFYSF